MAKKVTKDFLDAYKDYETACNRIRIAPYDYEQQMEISDNKKMQICRIVRNFLQHEKGTFIEPSKEMVAFISKKTDLIMAKVECVKDRTYEAETVKEEESFVIAAKKIKEKAPYIPVVDKDDICIGLLTAESIRKALVYHNLDDKIGDHIDFLEKITTIGEKLPVEGLPAQTYVVTPSGRVTDIYRGLLTIK